MLKETLCQIGFTRNEAKIYIALVELGPQPANIVAKRADLKRTTVYPMLKNLHKKSLISSFIKNGVKYFTVNNLDNLLEYVDRKKRLLDHHKDFVLDIIPMMEELKSDLSSQPKVHYFEGVSGVETVISDGLKSKGPILVIASFDEWMDSPLRDFLFSYINIQMRALVKDTERSRCFLKGLCKGTDDVCELMDIKFIKNGGELFDNIVHIYDNKVAIMSPERGFEFGVLIESKEFALTQRSMFELAWKGAMLHNSEIDFNGLNNED
jgi:hypothetical protein